MLNPLSKAFGLDIGDRSFKLVQLKGGQGRNSSYKLKAWGKIDVPAEVMDRGNILDKAAAAELIRKLTKNVSGRLSGNAVVACLPEAKTFIKIIEAEGEASDEASMKRAVLREIEENIPLPTNEIYYDWQAIEENVPVAKPEGTEDESAKKEERKEEPKTKLLLGAAPKQLVDEYTEMLDMASLAPVAFEIEAMAISRAVVPADMNNEEPIGILDIGGTRSSLIVYDQGIIQMSISIPVSGQMITETISKALSVSYDDAEKLKRECGLDVNRCEDKMWKILLPLIDDMAQKIRNALRFYKVGLPHGKDIEQVLLCGGGAHFREVDSALSKKLTVKVSRADALTNIRQPVPRKFKPNRALSYTTALGLAIRAADESGQKNETL